MAEGEGRGTGVEDILLILVILGGLAIAWFVSGGPTRTSTEKEGPFLLSPVEIGSPSPLSPLVDLRDEGYRGEIESASNDVARINDELAKAGDPGERSALYGTVVIAQSTSGVGSGSADGEYLTLRAAAKNSGPISISGWSLRSAMTGRSATLPRGTRVPVTGSVNDEEPIVLSPGEEAIVVSGRSPIGVSFRENRCTGYLSQFQSFSPSLDSQCPRPEAEVSFAQTNIGNDNRCLDYLESMSRCRIDTTPLPLELSQECRGFITTHVTYNGCVANHRNEPSFLGKTWRVFLRYEQPLWKERREVVKLLDEQGKTVDVFVY